MDLSKANLFVTGGAGCIGRAIARRRKEEGWTGKLTVYSTDDHKHSLMKSSYEDVTYIQGDIRNPTTLYMAMAGHDIVIHAAAVKVIPTSEYYSIDTYDVNVNGSINVFDCAAKLYIDHVLAISTDKACHPANAYGCTKMMMERAAQEFARVPGMHTEFHLVRYGNVLESTGSVIEVWKKAIERGERIKITNRDMTRFWLSPSQAVDCLLEALDFNSGYTLIPRIPALSIGKLAEYALGNFEEQGRYEIRPGEKMHETLLTEEETFYAAEDPAGYRFFVLFPAAYGRIREKAGLPYTSENARELTKEELTDMLND